MTPKTIGKRAFNIALSAEEVYRVLLNAMQCECAERGREMIDDADTRTHLQRIAVALTEKSPKFGLLLNGVPGNGKTTTAEVPADAEAPPAPSSKSSSASATLPKHSTGAATSA